MDKVYDTALPLVKRKGKTMSRYIDADFILDGIKNDRALIKDGKMDNYKEHYLAFLEKCVELTPSIDIVKCPNCRKCKEQGGYANCNGYLYCTRQKTMVDEDCFCAWGEKR